MSNATGSNIPANPTSQNVAALLPKLHDADSDYRFMALSDLQAMLEVGKPDFLHNDYNTAARTVDGILKTLDDQNGEVQNTAMKCLAPLVEKLPSSILAPLIEKLSTLRPENAVDNSIPATALRTVVITLPRPVAGVSPGIDVNEAYSAISRVLIPRLVGRLVVAPPAMSDKYLNKPSIKLPHPPQGMLELDANKEVDPEAVDILVEVVRCFGPLLQRPEVEALQGLLVGILDSDRTSSIVKKRAVVAVSVLAMYLPDQALSDFVSTLIESLRNPHNTPVQRKLYITILGSMARSIPARFGPYLKTLAPFVLSALSEQELEEQRENAAEDGERDPEIDDVREAALGALDGFLASCGSEMRAYTEESISAALLFLKYDPNYNDDDDDEEMGGTQPDEDDMDEFDDDEDFEQEAGYDDDDDDPSWKVRRCAAKTLYTLISTRGAGDLLDDGTLYREVAPMLVQRFNEREEHVRLEVITTLASLIRKTGGGIMINFSTDEGADYMSPAPQSRKRRRESSTSFDTKSFLSLSAGLTSPTLEPIPLSGPKADLAKLSPQIIKVTAKLLKTSSIATKQALISMLDDMIAVQHGGLSDHLSQLIDPIIEAIKNSSGGVNSSTTVGGSTTVNPGTLRIAALRFIGNVSKTHSSKILQPYLNKIVPGVVSAVNDRNYKISSEAIGTVEQFVKALTPPRSRSTQDHKSDFQKLYQIILDRVTATDADVEVRERAIHALGILLARTANTEGSTLLSSADRTAALDTVNDRLKNETTRLAAVRAIDTIAALSTSKDQLQPKWIREVSLELSAQLRKANRSLRGASLGALKNLVLAPASRKALDAETIQGLVSALLPLITASDLHMLGPALLVLAALVSDDAKLVVSDQLNTALSGLLVSPLGGSVLDALLVLVTNIGQAGVGQQLMATLLEQVGVRGDPAAVGKVIGTLLVYGGASVGVSLDSFLAELKNPQSNEAAKSLALSVLGEAGLRLEGKSPLKPSIFFEQFESQSDKVPLAAAIALGRAGAGNIPVFLPEILSHMTKGGSSQYLFLHSIKEILQQAGTTSSDINTYSQTIWGKLLVACKPEENKAVGAECIGRLVIIDPRVYMPQLQTILRDKDASLRALVIQAVRYTLPETDETFDAVLKTTLIDILQVMVHDNEIENRRLALTTLNAAAHNKPDLILPHLGQLLPLVIQESIIKPELIREVTMGPFKHKIDDGLELRKSAYETLYSLMEIAFSRISILDLYDRVIAGLQDEHDIRQLCNLMLSKLVHLDPDETARRLDALAGCFRSILMIKLKDNAVKQDVEKQDEAVRSALRITLLLHNAIPSASGTMAAQGMQHQTWRDYWEWVEKDFEVQLRALKDESKE